MNEGNVREKKRENVTNERWWRGNNVFVKKKVKEKMRIVTESSKSFAHQGIQRLSHMFEVLPWRR